MFPGSSTPEGVSWTLAGASRAASDRPAGPGAPAQERDPGPARSSLRCLHRHRRPVRDRDGRASLPSAPRACTRPCTSRPRKGFVILDSTLIATDRIAANEPYYSMKHRRHGMNVQVVAAPDGTPLCSRGHCPAARTT